jgi:hypothetical protein
MRWKCLRAYFEAATTMTVLVKLFSCHRSLQRRQDVICPVLGGIPRIDLQRQLGRDWQVRRPKERRNAL